jgi:flagellar FliL protein
MSKLRGLKTIVMVAAGLLLVANAGFFALQIGLFPSGTVSAFGFGTGAASQKTPASPTPAGPGIMYQMDDRIVNLIDASGLRYLKIGLTLEFDLPDARGLTGDAYKARQDQLAKDIASRLPIMDDAVTTILASKSWTSISSPGGKESLREELRAKLGDITGDYKLVNVYFTQFVIQ